MQACSTQRPGSALLRLSVQPDGRISHVTVYGDGVSGAEESCIARAMRGLHLPARSPDARRIDYTVSW